MVIISLSYSAGKRQIKVHCLPLSSYISPSARTACRFSLLHGELPALLPAAAELELVPGIVAEPAAEPARTGCRS